MFTDRDWKSLIVLNCLGIHGRRFAKELLKEGVLPSEVLDRVKSNQMDGGCESLRKIDSFLNPDRELENCRQKGIHLIPIGSCSYPKLLDSIQDPPLVLYTIGGTFQPDDLASVAVVGSRHPSLYGLEQAKKFSRGLAESGMTIVSGLAQGIDCTAHEAALEIPYGRTIAVLGCGVDVVYPKSSRCIYEKMIGRNNVIMSEYPLGTQPFAENFPRRNRIIAGLTLAVLVVEAHSRSGSLITAHQAAEQGRDVFAVPGPVDQITSRGTHRLLKEGAYLAESHWDILEILKPVLERNILLEAALDSQGDFSREEKSPDDTSENQVNQPKRVLNKAEQRMTQVLDGVSRTYEELIQACSLPQEEVLPLLTEMEMKGEICRQADGSFVLASH